MIKGYLVLDNKVIIIPCFINAVLSRYSNEYHTADIRRPSNFLQTHESVDGTVEISNTKYNMHLDSSTFTLYDSNNTVICRHCFPYKILKNFYPDGIQISIKFHSSDSQSVRKYIEENLCH